MSRFGAILHSPWARYQGAVGIRMEYNKGGGGGQYGSRFLGYTDHIYGVTTGGGLDISPRKSSGIAYYRAMGLNQYLRQYGSRLIIS